MEEPVKKEKPYTWRDDLKYGLGAPLILISVPLLLILAVVSLATGDSVMNWPIFFVLFLIISVVLL